MKRLLTVFTILSVILVLSACNRTSGSSGNESIKTVIYSLAGDLYIQGLEIGTSGSGYGFLDDTPFLMNAGSPTFTIIPHPSGTGNAIQLTDREQNYYALDIFFAGLGLTSGSQYVIYVSGTSAPRIQMQLGRTDEPWSALSSVTAGNDGKWQIEHTLSEAELTEHLSGAQRGARIMTSTSPNDDFTITEIVVTQIQTRNDTRTETQSSIPVTPGWDLTLPSLAQVFAGYFYIGNIWSNNSFMNLFNTQEGFLHHFNAATAENSHKPISFSSGGFIRPDASVFNFSASDLIVNWALENNLLLTGHALVWHNQSPPWLYENAQRNPYTRAEARSNMEFFIRTISEHYDSLGLLGAFYAWDVLNEAFESGGGRWGAADNDWYGGDWRTQLRDSPWLRAYANGYNESAGEHPSDYIYDAFVFARKYFPYSVLYYNDYNEEIPAKRNAIAQMTEQINLRWAFDSLNNPEAVPAGQTYTGRLLIEGIGMQSHYHLDQWRTNLDNLRPALERFAATGAILSITELDITAGGEGGSQPATLPVPMPQASLQRQADAYARIFGYYLEYADYIERISFWGKADNQSWRSWGQPLIFDASFKSKPAFDAIMDAVNSAAAPVVLVPVINSTTLPNGRINVSYRGAHLSAERNNNAPVSWSVIDGELPPGLRLFSATGVIGGIPVRSGTYTFTIAAENMAGAGTRTFTITVL